MISGMTNLTTNVMSSVSHTPEPPRFLSKETARELMTQIRSLSPLLASPQDIYLYGAWRNSVGWARNRTTLAGDWRDTTIAIGREGTVWTNQTDLASLKGGVQWLDSMYQLFLGNQRQRPAKEILQMRRLYPATYIWSDATYAQTQDTRLEIANRLIAGAEAAGMLSAGFLSVEAQGCVTEMSTQRLLYAPLTEAQCSMTVRDPEGTASGWAGRSSYAWERIDADKLAAVALEKCLRSRNPVRVEPGRYTLIMEPQATFGLLYQLWRNWRNVYYWDLGKAQQGGPFYDNRPRVAKVSNFGRNVVVQATKMGQRVFDPRINISFDPLDPDLGVVPFLVGGYPIQPVPWVTNGVLTALSYPPAMDAFQAIQYGNRMDIRGKPEPGSFRVDGGAHTTTLEEMIATTERGLLTTRFWGVTLLDIESALCTGSTRDGLWLIEHGKITHACKNLRFTESPLFVLNQVEQVGVSEPVFSPGFPAVTPYLKVRDFSFTSLEDAV